MQFHPEKSGAAGARWLERCLSRVDRPPLTWRIARVVKGIRFEDRRYVGDPVQRAPRTRLPVLDEAGSGSSGICTISEPRRRSS